MKVLFEIVDGLNAFDGVFDSFVEYRFANLLVFVEV